MAKRLNLDYNMLFERLRKYLISVGSCTSKEICEHLKISQPAFSKLLKKNEDQILVAGKASLARYALRRVIGKYSQIPIFKIESDRKTSSLALLHPIYPKGFYLEKMQGSVTSRFYSDLPYFLEDLRPSGFLGRLVPRKYPEYHFPNNILSWSQEHHLQFLAELGWDLVGNLIVGEEAFKLYLEQEEVSQSQKNYTEIAEQVITLGGAGSSAGGEQPKFLTINSKQIPVLVKFSPPNEDKISRRISDLLVCEHLALQTLTHHGFLAAASKIIDEENRIFLEVIRFDRTKERGRIGVISLKALDLEFVGKMETWSKTAEALLKLKKIDEKTSHQIHFLEMFGNLIANTDMHGGNLSFFIEGESILNLTPVYDMLPMQYAPTQGQLIASSFEPQKPLPSEAEIWKKAYPISKYFWEQVISSTMVSKEFKTIAEENLEKLNSLSEIEKLLPY